MSSENKENNKEQIKTANVIEAANAVRTISGNGYCLSQTDTIIFLHWLSTLRGSESKRLYRNAVLQVCEIYGCTLSGVTPEQWITFMNQYIPEQIITHGISVSYSRIYYYAICGFLTYYRQQIPDYPDFTERFLSPAETPLPKMQNLPTAEHMAALLQYLRKADPRFQLIVALSYECALSLNEIIGILVSDLHETAEGICYLQIRGNRERKIEIRDDLLKEIENYLLQGGYHEDEYLFHNNRGKPYAVRALQKHLKELQEPLVEQGILPCTYSIASIRTAAIHRSIAADNANVIETAQYVGVTPAYVQRIQSVSHPRICELPGNRKNLTLEKLLSESIKNGDTQINYN